MVTADFNPEKTFQLPTREKGILNTQINMSDESILGYTSIHVFRWLGKPDLPRFGDETWNVPDSYVGQLYLMAPEQIYFEFPGHKGLFDLVENSNLPIDSKTAETIESENHLRGTLRMSFANSVTEYFNHMKNHYGFNWEAPSDFYIQCITPVYDVLRTIQILSFIGLETDSFERVTDELDSLKVQIRKKGESLI